MSNQEQAQSRQAASTSPHSRRSTLSERISAVGAKINRALSSDTGRASQNAGYDPETESITSTIVEGNDRSSSRGRNFHSSGRGGAGNIHAGNGTSNPNGEVQDFPWPRGRERAPVARVAPPVRSTGRGGSGNFSQSPPVADPSYSMRDREIIRAHAEADKTNFRSSGRGGMGNIVSPEGVVRSRSRSIDPVASPTSMRFEGANGAGYSHSPSRERQRNGSHSNGMNGYGGGT